jgi:DNA-binding SARP family transcriptional activator/tetratricopeptide (TPR) repeat protein
MAAAWGEAAPPTARTSLHGYVVRLRKALGNGTTSPIVTLPGGYLITVGPGELDVRRFEDALAAGQEASRAGDWAAAARLLSDGLALWRGDPLADIASEYLEMREVPRLAELRLQALEARIGADLRLGRQAEVIPELRQLTAAEPLRERLSVLLMTALDQDGQRAAALAAYQAARGVLVAELGTEPGEGLRRAQQQILAGQHIAPGPGAGAGHGPGAGSGPGAGAGGGAGSGAGSGAGGGAGSGAGGGAGSGAEPRAAGAVRFSLPPDTAAFTGRDDEIGRITATVTASAQAGGVVAIHAIGGMPGIGKTALAVHVAHLLSGRFPDRQLFIDLRGHTPGQDPLTPGGALAALLAAAGADLRNLPDELDGRIGLWRDTMAGQRAVLVLDNAASTAQAAPLLPGGDTCLVLVTSRRQLADLPGAVPVPLEVMPPKQAQEMFVRLAPRAAAGPDWAIAELTELAGYLPLAISLLARVLRRHPAWTLADLAQEARTRLLTLTAEQDTVAAVFEVSWQHLDPGQQDFFRHLGLYPGVTIDAYAAAALAGIPLDQAARQLDGLHREGILAETGYRRYGMHDLIRRYAADRAAGPAGEQAEALGRLLDYYQHTAAQAGDLLDGRAPGRAGPAVAPPAAAPALPDTAAAVGWARAERMNLLASLDQVTRAGQLPRVVSLTAALAAVLRRDGPWTDDIGRHSTALEAARALGDRPGQVAALRSLGLSQRLTGDHSGATATYREALDIYEDLDDQAGRAGILRQLGLSFSSTADYPGAARALEEALSIYGQLGDQHGQAVTRQHLGDLRRLTGDLSGAATILTEALTGFRELGDRGGQAGALSRLGHVRQMTGGYPAAVGPLEESLHIFQELGQPSGQAGVLLNLGPMRSSAGDHPGAISALEEALDIYRRLASKLGMMIALGNLGPARRLAGDGPGAAQALGEALVLARELGGRGAQAEIHNALGALHLDQGDVGQARDAYRVALDLAREIGGAGEEAHALAGLARCARAEGDLREAAAGLREAQRIFESAGAADAAGIADELAALGQGSVSPGA